MSNQARPLSKYRMIIELARGGMGDVYLAVSRGPGGFHKLVVIKELRSALATDNEFLTMFMEEAKLSARLHHPNIVQTNEVGQDANRYFMAMEYLEGQALNRCAQRIPRDQFTLAHQLRILVDALGGLHYAHELADYDGTPLHIVHRDISPHNILVTYDGQAKIVDFGIAKTRESAQQTATGVLKGKVPYMAPEQLDRNQDRRADVFAIGVMLWEAVAGRRMWAGKTDLGIVQALAEMKIPSIREGKPDVPEELERIVSLALAPNRDKRYQTAQEFATDLEAYLDAMSEHVSNKQIGKLLSTTFAAEREQIRSVIEEQLKQVRVADSDQFVAAAEIPKLDLAQGTEYTPSDGHHSSGKTPAAALLNVPGGTQTGSRSGANAFPAAPPPAAGKTKIGMIVASGVALAAGVLIWNGARGGHDAAPTPATGASGATTAATAADLVDLVIKAVPDDAQLYVDDVPVSGNPYKTRVPKGGYHQIRAEAPGFAPALEMRSMESDAVMNLVLERVKSDTGAKRASAPPPPRGAAARPVPASRPAPAAPAPTAAPTAAPHSIDTSDPYSR